MVGSLGIQVVEQFLTVSEIQNWTRDRGWVLDAFKCRGKLRDRCKVWSKVFGLV